METQFRPKIEGLQNVQRSGRIFPAIAVLVLVLLLAIAGAITWFLQHAEPLVRARMIATLSKRFSSPVELDRIELSFRGGIKVEGTGLRILYLAGPTRPDAHPTGAAPMLAIRSFQFRTGVRELFEPKLRVVTLQVDGAELHIPPREERSPLLGDNPARRGQPPDSILIDKIVFNGLTLVIETRKPGAVPLVFSIANLTLNDVGRTQTLRYDATLRNPKPVGDVRATGHFGPWQDSNPRDTPLDGSYLFTHADLSTIKGLGGTLASNGSFRGTLGGIAVDGTTDTPDFRLTTSNHSMPLHTDFHAMIDATTGDTTLQPVVARLPHSVITATGSITRKQGVPGHDVELDVAMDRARIDDLLTLAVRTYPPVVRGPLTARAHISIPRGGGTVTRRMHLQGTFSMPSTTFTNARLQAQIDSLSERARGWPEKANGQQAPSVTAAMQGGFELRDEQMTMPGMTYTMPGATVRVEGRYGLDGASLDFHGTVRTEATASEMVGGWRSLLVMPFDGLLKKGGAGMEVRFKLSGTQADPKLDLDFGHETCAGMHAR